jgi:putative oxidoreductase
MKTDFNIDLRVMLRWLLGVLLLWAALSKLANVSEFYVALAAYKLPGPPIIFKLISIVLPWLELLCGLMLLARVQLRAALVWTTILFAVFALVTGIAWARGLNISCGCLHLDFLGLEGNAMGHFLESAAFACLRAVLLCAAAIFLFKNATEERSLSH